MKLVRDEAESPALKAALGPDDRIATSAVGDVEVRRVIERFPDREAARQLWEAAASGLRIMELTEQIGDLAATAPPTLLRTLDAIHLASALVLKPELDAFVVYDRRLAAAAAALGLPVSSPGAAA